ncbi:thioredoxin family protein [Tamlana sp. 62-3]|uniref:Thioredoxin family protein n=2 Tax=Neotamlana sargassicola TaxID=2883125 RepID=A0A9X1I463_9FLAO|nr:thioredoxin family protein [Tamlana sargassicola]
MKLKLVILSTLLGLYIQQTIIAQNTNAINWLSFSQLEDSLAIKPKKVFINFYADWCVYCKKKDKVAFKDKSVISKLNKDYYAVKMNAETTDTITFGNETFINKEIGKKRNPTHQIPLLLASRKNIPFSLPATVILNEQFIISERFFEYLDSEKLLDLLSRK